MIKRDYYLEKIKDKMWNGSVKIITGIRRCGKSYILNELVRLGCSVDVGVVDVWDEDGGKKMVRHHEIDFVVNTGFEKIYMQSAFSISDPEYKAREILPMNKTGDNFRKIVVTSGASRLWTDENGISYVGILTFLMNPERVLP